MKPWLQQVLIRQQPASKQLEDFFNSIDPKKEQERKSRLRMLVTGQIGDCSLFYVSIHRVGGEEVVAQLESVTADDRWRKLLDQTGQAIERREFLVLFADRLLFRINPYLRCVQMMNGIIQLLTVFVAWFVVIRVVYRFYLLPLPWSRASLKQYGDCRTPEWQALQNQLQNTSAVESDGSAESNHIRNGFRSTESDIRRHVYDNFGFGVALLPPLGFIGTVFGMGKALLNANGLFSSNDKQKTITDITDHLGSAFDTTLVALVLSLVVGFTVFSLAKYEFDLLHKWQRLILRENVNRREE